MGWIKLDRQIQDNFLYSAEPFDKCHAWIDLLFLASHKDEEFYHKGRLIKLKRGQLITSPEKLAKRWKWSKNKVYRFLRVLSDADMVIRNGTPNGTALTLVNYSKFQGRGNTDGTPNGTPNESPDGSSGGTHSRNKRNKEDIYTPKQSWDDILEEFCREENNGITN